MTKLARLLIVSLLALALAPASPLGIADAHAAKGKKERVAKKKKTKKAKAKRAAAKHTTATDPTTSVTDPGTSVTDPNTTIPGEQSGNPAQQCKAERAKDAEAFADKYGTNHNKANALGKCVSEKAHAKKTSG